MKPHYGRKHPKLTVYEINYIRTTYAFRFATQKQLARQHGVSQATISKIVTGVTHVSRDDREPAI